MDTSNFGKELRIFWLFQKAKSCWSIYKMSHSILSHVLEYCCSLRQIIENEDIEIPRLVRLRVIKAITHSLVSVNIKPS